MSGWGWGVREHCLRVARRRYGALYSCRQVQHSLLATECLLWGQLSVSCAMPWPGHPPPVERPTQRARTALCAAAPPGAGVVLRQAPPTHLNSQACVPQVKLARGRHRTQRVQGGPFGLQRDVLEQRHALLDLWVVYAPRAQYGTAPRVRRLPEMYQQRLGNSYMCLPGWIYILVQQPCGSCHVTVVIVNHHQVK